VLVNDEGLATLSLLKIQSDPLGNLRDLSFDGDEMNLHMPQDPESEAELKNLAAVPYQIISPANNSSIIGIFQDSMLGCYQFSRSNIRFNPREAMNLLMMFNEINEQELIKNIQDNGGITNFDILSQIMPPLSMKYKTKAFKEDKDDGKTSNAVIEIKNGKYIRGQMDKSVLGAGTKGLLQRICNDFGNMASAKFIDDLQNVVTEYMKSTAFSVGISDLISDQKTNDEIVQVITKKKTDVKNLIDQVQIGIFENNTGKSNEEEFETQVNSILNQATSESGKIGLKSLDKDNRFVIMVNAGSKGSDLNISQMISCLGQQNVDGKRIPYGFENRTLPHFTKYDDSPGARGFVESSYINGLSPQELFFHAMGGRVGLIDTAVKTSTTGYIQRRLIKGLEDLMVNYDMTIRTNKNKIVQFAYGDDNIDTTKVENQPIAIVSMSTQDIFAHFLVPEESGKIKTLSNLFLKNVYTRYKKQLSDFMDRTQKYIDMMIEKRDSIIKYVFKNKSDSVVNCPVAFSYIINNIQGQCNITISSLVDLTLLEALEMIEKCYSNLNKNYYAPPTELFKTLYYYYLSPKDLLIVKRFNKSALTLLLDTITIDYKRAIVAPGEMVGMIAGQSIGEVSTQMSVTYESQHKIVIKNKQTGDFEIKSVIMGEFCDQIIANNLDKTFNTNHVDSVETILTDLENEYYIVGVSEDEKTSWNKISHVSKHPVNGQMMRVTTRSGRIVDTTTSHSHLIRKDHKVTAIKGSEMVEGMRIPVCAQINNQEFIKNTYQNINLDSLMGWFIGAYLAEGDLNYNEISITNVSDYYVENTKKVAALFGKECRITEKQDAYGKSITAKFTCKEFASVLLNTCGNGSFVKKVPDFAFTASIEFKAAMFQGYFDGAGNFQSDAKHHQIRCCSRSQQLVKDLAFILNYFGIYGNIKTEENKGKPLYHLNIAPKYAKIYQTKIGSILHNEKLTNLVQFIERNDVKFLSEQIDKINGLGEIIAYCGKTLKLPGQSRIYGFWKNKESVGRRTLEKYYQTFKENDTQNLISAELKIIEQAITSNVVWDEIIKIDYYTPDQTNYVYDFTIPGNQTFMTDYGVIVHNTLNTFHFAGVASKSNVTRGVPRIEEILSLSSDIKNPSLSIYLNHEDERSKEKAQTIMYMLEHTKLEEIVKSVQVCFDPDDLNSLIVEDKDTIEQYKAFENMIEECNEVSLQTDENEKSKWIIRMEMDPEIMLEKNITMDDVNYTLKSCFEDQINCIYSDFNADKLIFRIRMNEVIKNGSGKGSNKTKVNPLDQSDHIYLLKNFQDQLLQNVVLRGIKGINKVILRKIVDNIVEHNGVYTKEDIWVLDTIGTNLLDVLGLSFIDNKRTLSNDIVEIYNVLGIEAARQAIYNELVEVVEFDGTYINFHNYSVLVDRMTYTEKLISIFRHGINNDNIGPIAKASFEETPEMFLKAAKHADLDTLKGVSANVMCGQEGFFGTSAFQVVLNIEEMQKLEAASEYKPLDVDAEIEMFFGESQVEDDKCSVGKIAIQNNVITIHAEDMGNDNDYNPGF
jgi:DNA-directed RNA polymerase beta' subunit